MLLLLGTEWVRQRRRVLAVVGSIWIALGVTVFIDALDGVVFLPLRAFGFLILVEGLLLLVATSNGWAARRRLLRARATIGILLGILVVLHRHITDIILAMLLGITFAVDGGFRIASALVVRFRGWRLALAGGIAEIGFAVFMVEPLATYYRGTAQYCVGLVLALSGWNMLRVAWHLRALPPNASLSELYSRGWPNVPGLPTPAANGPLPPEKLVVRVWTASGTADHPVRRPLIDRYIAAEDASGVVSTGHSALEVKPDIYISHYPAVDLDHSSHDFMHLLRATHDNDVEGVFQPSYEHESKHWCESTMNVEFERYDPARLRAFWERYRQDTTYNLTARNCSSTVVHSLETALEGVLAGRSLGRHYLIRMLCSPELIVAVQMRNKAEEMTWTPGLALDYSRALCGALDPPRLTTDTFVRLLRFLPGRHRWAAPAPEGQGTATPVP
jgi:uncharacterized membrane protein HdeD (DUF308 family)